MFILNLIFIGKKNKLNPIIVSYPRSGQSYVKYAFTLSFLKSFKSSHLNKPGEIDDLKNYDYVIMLTRNPLDSISSMVAMEMEFFPHYDLKETVEKRIKEYIKFYSIALNKIDLFIDFEDIANNFNKVINYVSVHSGYPILNNEITDYVNDDNKTNFLKSSKKSKNYEKVFDFVKSYDLNQCSSLYNLSLERCINLSEI